MHTDWLVPQWHAGEPVAAVMTTRAGGVSTGPFASMNLGRFVGDDPANVEANIATLREAIGVEPVLLKQVHGTRVVCLDEGEVDETCSGAGIEADASYTTRAGRACVVTVADCLPVLLAAPGGRGVAAAHAGWRGLAGGIVEKTLADLCEAAGCGAHEVVAWLGACIGASAFEVGADVLHAFGNARPERFVPRPAAAGQRWLADLPGLARDRLLAAGVSEIAGGNWCTVSDASRFFSFRRDRITGRMAAAIWLRR
ncbi:MAG TPA: peptidoglycan editing factor PgeF [Burkholderiaceae bacterium]|nr:peptidoglycan editing factor PgeF [Burkholderiaceae bacterium]